MIYLDNQGGRSEAYAHADLTSTIGEMLTDRSVPWESRKLKYGDASLIGNGPGGQPVRVGVEIKKVGDFLSSIYNQRLAGHQLPGMARCYDRSWLVVEGRMRCSPNGRLEYATKWGWSEPKGGSHDWRAVQSYLLTLTVIGGVHVQATEDREGTADFLASLHYWWGKKVHRGLEALDYQPASHSAFTSTSTARAVAAQLDAIGYTRSGTVVAAFGTVEAMAAASLKEWQKVVGPKVGKAAYESLRRRG